MRERVEAMRAIWTKTKPEYTGEFVKFGPMMTWPKPVQKPHPPVLVGGGLPHGARRALAYGDGWMPHAQPPDLRDLLDKLPEFREMGKAAGRTLPITAFGVEHDPALWGRLPRRRHGAHRAQHQLGDGGQGLAATRLPGRQNSARSGRGRHLPGAAGSPPPTKKAAPSTQGEPKRGYRNRGATSSHISCSERMTLSLGMRPPQLSSARTPLRPSLRVRSSRRIATEAGVPTITFSRSASS